MIYYLREYFILTVILTTFQLLYLSAFFRRLSSYSVNLEFWTEIFIKSMGRLFPLRDISYPLIFTWLIHLSVTWEEYMTFHHYQIQGLNWCSLCHSVFLSLLFLLFTIIQHVIDDTFMRQRHKPRILEHISNLNDGCLCTFNDLI